MAEFKQPCAQMVTASAGGPGADHQMADLQDSSARSVLALPGRPLAGGVQQFKTREISALTVAKKMGHPLFQKSVKSRKFRKGIPALDAEHGMFYRVFAFDKLPSDE